VHDAPTKAAKECIAAAEAIEDFMLERQSLTAKQREKCKPDFRTETQNLFQHRLGPKSRLLIEALAERGAIDASLVDAQDVPNCLQLVRLGRVHPDEIDELAYQLRKGAEALTS